MTRGVARAFAPAVRPVRSLVLPTARRRGWTRRTARIGLALALVYVVWGSTYVAIDVAIDTVPPMSLMAVRFAVAGGLLYVVAVRRGDRHGDRVTVRQVGQAVFTGGTMLMGGTGLITLAMASISSGLAALLAATVPLWLALFARGAFGERLAWPAWLGLAVGMVGIGLLVDPSGGQLGGILLALIGAAAWAAGSLHSRVARAPSRPMVAAALEMMGASLVFAVVGVVRGEPAQIDVGAVAPQAWFAFAYLVVAGSLVAYTAYSWLLRNASTSLVGTHAYVNPVVAVTLGWLLLGEAIEPRTLLAGGVVLIGVVLLITGRPGEPVPAQITSGADVFAGQARWRRIRHKVGSLPRAARLYVDPGAQPYRSTGYDPPAYRFDQDGTESRAGFLDAALLEHDAWIDDVRESSGD
jgi:drug/metabolite transporter (DMT)-like permease